MKIKVPHVQITVTSKERHFLEIIIFIVLFFLLHWFGVFGFIFGIIDKVLVAFGNYLIGFEKIIYHNHKIFQ